MHRRIVVSAVAVLVTLCTFAAGALTSHLIEGEAQARPAATPANVLVPTGGLAFRTADGHIVARLSYTAQGGVFEVFDEKERPTSVVQSAFVRGIF